MPPSRHSLAGKCIEVERGAVNIEPFVLKKHLRAGFHVSLSVRLENLLRTAFGDLADAARTTHSMRESHLPVSRHLPVAVTVAVAVRACPIRRSPIRDELSAAALPLHTTDHDTTAI